jgi:hypothetical protein
VISNQATLLPLKRISPPYNRISTSTITCAAVAENENSSPENILLQNLTPSARSSTSANSSTAQQSYTALQQELQQFALGSGSDASTLLAESPVSFLA